MNPKRLIVVCRCRQMKALPTDTADALIAALRAAGRAVLAVDDLCAAIATRDERILPLAGAENLAVVACAPRAVTWLLATAGIGTAGQQSHLLNLRGATVEGLLTELGVETSASTTVAPGGRPRMEPVADVPHETEWAGWFPVIDFEKCTNCRQCRNFCLFNVFGADDRGMIRIDRPANCKTNCPACARVCPQQAILFPKHRAAPINGEPAAEGEGEPVKADLSKLTAGDVMSTLRNRNKTAAGSMAGLAELCPCVEDLRELDIPEEILAEIAPQLAARHNVNDSSGEQASVPADAEEDQGKT
jgi:Pyruvate/2-oxoacid:ferredoxin oxidoreductase delta subunit